MQKRKELIFYSQDKFNAVIKLAEIYKDKKIMIFTERVNVANLLQKAIPNSFVYNPKKSEKALTKLMNEYKEMDNGVLIAAKALDEGMDIPGIDIGIIHSNSSSKLQGTQRNGRIIRKSNDKVALIINLYLENTQDKKWLLRRIEGIPNMYWTNDINQITYDPSEECLKEENRTSDFTQRIKLF
jgi:superfamily II DNA or RNA helicase